MNEGLHSLLGRDKYEQLLREAEAERRAGGLGSPALGIRMRIAQILVNLAVALAEAERARQVRRRPAADA